MAKAPEKTGDKGADQVPARPKRDDGATNAFEVASTVLHDGETYGPGETVLLTRRDFDALKTAGAITGEWPASK